MDNAPPALPFLYSHQLKMFCFKVVAVVISLRRLLFCLWIIQEAPHFIPCDYVKDFVVFYQPYQRGHQKCSFVFLFVQASAFELPMMTKNVHVQYIMKNTVTTSDRNSNLWCNLLQRFPSVTSHNLSHTLDICFNFSSWWVTTTQIMINNLTSIRERFMPVIPETFLLICHHTVAATWLTL